MQLHVPLPPDIETQLPEPAQYALPYDLTCQGEPVEGYCVASKTNLYFFEQGRMERCYPISACQDLSSEQLIGSGSLNARIEGQMTLPLRVFPSLSYRLCGVYYGVGLHAKHPDSGGGRPGGSHHLPQMRDSLTAGGDAVYSLYEKGKGPHAVDTILRQT